MLKGIDISHHDGNIDFSKVKSQVDFIIIKLGNIGDNKKFWLDDNFEKNYSECQKYNIPVGVYIYCYTNIPENAKIGGKLVRNYLKDKPLELPIYIDIEDDELKNESKETITDIIISFNSEIEKDCKWAGIYCNKNWLNNKMNTELILDKYTNWIQMYPKTIDIYRFIGTYDIWQCSKSGKIEGINGKVDINIMYRDLIKEIGNSIMIDDNYYSKCSNTQKSFVEGLKEIGENSSFANRTIIAKNNGIYKYSRKLLSKYIFIKFIKKRGTS